MAVNELTVGQAVYIKAYEFAVVMQIVGCKNIAELNTGLLMLKWFFSTSRSSSRSLIVPRDRVIAKVEDNALDES